MPLSPYFPHVLYSVALTSISINIVGFRRSAEDEKSRVNAQISILESIRHQLRSAEPLSVDELERLKKLARHSRAEGTSSGESGEQVSWSDVFSGKAPSKDGELSKWDQQDLETIRKELSKEI